MSDTAPSIPAVRYPDLAVHLAGLNGNAFVLLAAVTKALRWYGVDEVEIDLFDAEAKAGDYDALLRTCMAWVDVR